MRKILPLSVTAAGVMALIIGFMPLAQAQVTSDTVQGQVTILGGGTCGLIATGGDPIVFGSLTPGGESGAKTVTVSNTGSSNTNIWVSGANWQGSVPDVMLVGATHYQPSSGGGPAWGDKPALTATATDTGFTVVPGLTKGVDFQLKANLAVAGATGPATQNIFIGTLC